MNKRSLKILEESMEFSPKWVSLEISCGSIYLDFKDIGLSNPKKNNIFSIRFASNAFISFFYNDIWDLDFISNYDFSTDTFHGDFSFLLTRFKFLDFNYLDELFKYYSHEKILPNNNFDVHNIRNDFFLTFKLKKIAICVSADEMDFFLDSEKLDSDSIKNLSNEWVLFYLDYCSKKRIKKDPICKKLFN